MGELGAIIGGITIVVVAILKITNKLPGASTVSRIETTVGHGQAIYEIRDMMKDARRDHKEIIKTLERMERKTNGRQPSP